MVIVLPLNGKLPEFSGRWRSFQLTFISYLLGCKGDSPLTRVIIFRRHVSREANARVAVRFLGGFSGEPLGLTMWGAFSISRVSLFVPGTMMSARPDANVVRG